MVSDGPHGKEFLMAKGKVYIVGAGPGDPGLITVRAKEVLTQADVVLYDALIHSRILNLIPTKARQIFRGSRGKSGSMSQGQINALLVQLAGQGKRVVRLKGGDPFVFGRGAEEILALVKAKIPFEVVPGVTSAVAVPAYAGIPVTYRSMNSSFTVVTGHEDPAKDEAQVNWINLAQDDGTLVFLMGLHTLPNICLRLIQEGKDPKTPAAVIQWGTTPRQKMVQGTLESIYQLVKKAQLQPPSALVVGKVVGLADRLKWFHPKPLSGLRVLITRTRSQASFLSEQLEEKGAEVIEIPTIEIVPLPLSPKASGWLRGIDGYDWIVFSSTNAVEIFMEHLFKLGKDARALGRVKIACVGEVTARSLKAYGLQADVVPKDYKQEGLVRSLQRISWQGRKVLFARGREGRDLLLDFFKKKKAKVDFWPLYKNTIPPGTLKKLRELLLPEKGVGLLTFASSSSADHFYGLFPSRDRRQVTSLPVAVIGPVTASSVRKWGGKVVVMPSKYTMPALVSAIEKWAKGKSFRS
jgi:uroporphyrinogen III methyltransferase / synthase